MHNHDHDLIAALAEGTLDAAEAAMASSDIAGCPECQGELDAQRLALSALSQAPTPGLSMAESAQMRRGVADALGIKEAPAAAGERRRLPWAGLVTAAAVLVAVVAAAPLLNLLSTSDESSVAAPTPAEARAEADTEQLGDDDLSAGDVAEAPTAAVEAPAAGTPATTSVATEEGLADLELQLLSFGEIAEEDLATIADAYSSYRASSFADPGDLNFTNQQILELNSRLGNLQLRDASAPLPFCEIAATDSFIYLQLGVGTYQESDVLVFVGPAGSEEPVVILLDAESCSQLASSSDQ